jgi:hypothetical protein
MNIKKPMNECFFLVVLLETGIKQPPSLIVKMGSPNHIVLPSVQHDRGMI